MKKFVKVLSLSFVIMLSLLTVVFAESFVSSDVKIEYTSVTYSGKELKPKVTVSSLKQGKDYYVSYANNVNVGRGTVIVDEVNDKCDPVYKYFDITPCNISKTKIKLKYTYATYDGEKKQPEVTVTYNGKTLKKNKDYKVSYKNNKNTGKATVVITGLGNFKGEVKKYFYIKPSKVLNLSVEGKTHNSISLKWDKVKGADKYRIYYKKDGKSTLLKSCESNSCTVKNLKSDTVYKLEVRAVTELNDKTLYGKAGNSLSVRTKLSSNDPVYVTDKGSKYHRKNCSYIKSGKKRVTYSYALKQGYKKCSRCF